MSYFSTVQDHVEDLVTVLHDKGVQERYLEFGGPGPELTTTPRVPTDARSEFLANRAMGDWAENVLAKQINDDDQNGITAVQYGDSDRMSAGEPGFKEFYLERLDDVRRRGKRPDLLIMPDSYDGDLDVSNQATQDLNDLVSSAVGSIEVRSSKFEAIHYMNVRRAESKSGKLAMRQTPSFTVKVEDLKIVYRWLEKYNKSQIYAQVFFDSVFAINFEKIFEIISSGEGFTIENPAKSQEKSTIMIPITSGYQIGRFETIPDFTVEKSITRLGRHDAYVKPEGGQLILDSGLLKTVISNS